MKIGILGCFYNCNDLIAKVLEPWLFLKGNSNHEFVITGVHTMFNEYSELDDEYEIETYESLLKLNLDFVHSSIIPMDEASARNIPLNYLLNKECDVIWLLDGDEIYTVKEINDIITYIEPYLINSSNAYFSINFKNLFDTKDKFIDGFCPPRIFNNKINKGVSIFYWDNDIMYKDKTPYKNLVNLQIPRSVAHVEHHTWLSNETSKKKIQYQLKHFKGICGYKWNEDENKIEINEDHYKQQNLPTPKIKNV